mgnify:CR=1 FL=1
MASRGQKDDHCPYSSQGLSLGVSQLMGMKLSEDRYLICLMSLHFLPNKRSHVNIKNGPAMEAWRNYGLVIVRMEALR